MMLQILTKNKNYLITTYTMDKTNSKFSIINKDSYKRVSGREKKDDEFIKFGDDNMYPNYLINLYNHSAIHASCVNAIVEAIRGEGLVTED